MSRTAREALIVVLMGLALLVVPGVAVIFGDNIKAMIPGTSISCPAGVSHRRGHDVGARP